MKSGFQPYIQPRAFFLNVKLTLYETTMRGYTTRLSDDFKKNRLPLKAYLPEVACLLGGRRCYESPIHERRWTCSLLAVRYRCSTPPYLSQDDTCAG